MFLINITVTEDLPARVLYGRHKIHHKAPSPVEPDAAPERQGLESSLALVPPGATEALRGIIAPGGAPGGAPGWTIGTHILYIP